MSSTITTTKRQPRKYRADPRDMTEPIKPMERIRTAAGEVDGIVWTQSEAERVAGDVHVLDDGRVVVRRRK